MTADAESKTPRMCSHGDYADHCVICARDCAIADLTADLARKEEELANARETLESSENAVERLQAEVASLRRELEAANTWAKNNAKIISTVLGELNDDEEHARLLYVLDHREDYSRPQGHELMYWAESLLRKLQAAERRMKWLEDNHTLHKSVEILYVVDGYEVTLMHENGTSLSESFHGETLDAAIDAAQTERNDSK